MRSLRSLALACAVAAVVASCAHRGPERARPARADQTSGDGRGLSERACRDRASEVSELLWPYMVWPTAWTPPPGFSLLTVPEADLSFRRSAEVFVGPFRTWVGGSEASGSEADRLAAAAAVSPKAIALDASTPLSVALPYFTTTGADAVVVRVATDALPPYRAVAQTELWALVDRELTCDARPAGGTAWIEGGHEDFIEAAAKCHCQHIDEIVALVIGAQTWDAEASSYRAMPFRLVRSARSIQLRLPRDATATDLVDALFQLDPPDRKHALWIVLE